MILVFSTFVIRCSIPFELWDIIALPVNVKLFVPDLLQHHSSRHPEWHQGTAERSLFGKASFRVRKMQVLKSTVCTRMCTMTCMNRAKIKQ
jgi:hypothetical protein